ncbi:redoxin domain-containing protein [Halobaculum gomorrense]|uniref:Peroxiredoxin Q/BCP n=1 Tax=Halobaculum gomorrense TaxID=43928 RepID=A0A1M5N1H2_9EURY|nr:redoxin domain-containing protein [Halobaculum gomorrense]SHG83410.1 peroxiredoxin Q/BCP [Halobaculum gomorrense]
MPDSTAAGAPAPTFSLRNLGPGPDPYGLADAATDNDALLLLFQRDYLCGNCRKQVARVKTRYEEFAAVDAEVASVLPESPERTRDWQESVELPYPVLADPDGETSDAYDQPVRFGVLGNLFDLVGRMPLALVVDLRDEPTIASAFPGTRPADRPAIDDLLAACRAVTEGASGGSDPERA